jgi:hypothetical protein
VVFLVPERILKHIVGLLRTWLIMKNMVRTAWLKETGTKILSGAKKMAAAPNTPNLKLSRDQFFSFPVLFLPE